MGEGEAGICAIRILQPITDPKADEQGVPDEIKEYVAMVERSMNSSDDKSVSATILYWDQMKLLGKPEHGQMGIFAVRNNTVRHHNHARSSLADLDITGYAPAATMYATVITKRGG